MLLSVDDSLLAHPFSLVDAFTIGLLTPLARQTIPNVLDGREVLIIGPDGLD